MQETRELPIVNVSLSISVSLALTPSRALISASLYAPGVLQVMPVLRAEGVAGKVVVLVDGGARRGTDIFKAIALGATAVGLGRPIIYALAAYGEEVVHCILCM